MKNKSNGKGVNFPFLLTVLLCFCIGIAAGIMMPYYFKAVPESHGTPVALAILVLYLIASFYISIFLHEGGHLVFGLMTGYRFSSLRIGSLMLVKINGKLKFKLHSVSGTGGQCLLAPPKFCDGKFPHVLYNLGGVISNFVFTLIFAGAAYLTREHIYATSLFVVLIVINLTLGISNAIPLSTASVDNDGKNALSLGKNPTAMRALWIQLAINANSADGKRLKDMPEPWFELPKKEELKNAFAATLVTFRENRFMDMQLFDEAIKLIEEYKNETSLPGIYKVLMTLDEITVKALKGESYDEIAKLFTKEVHAIMNSMKSFPTVLRTKYVFALLVENNSVKAAKFLDVFNKIEKTYPYATDLASEREIMRCAQEEAAVRKSR